MNYYQQNYEPNPTKGYQYQNNLDTSDICDDVHFFLVMPFTAEEADHPENHPTVPFVLTFLNEETKIYELMKDYQKTFPYLKDKYLYFTYRNGDRLCEEMTVTAMKKQLGRENANGLVLFVQEDPELYKTHYEDYLDPEFDDIYVDEKCVMEYLSKQEEFGNHKMLSIFIELPIPTRPLPEIFTLSINGESKVDELKNRIVSEMRRQFEKVNLLPKDILELFNKDIKKAIKSEGSLIQQRLKQRGSTIVVKLANPNTPLRRIKGQDYNSYIVIYKEGEKEPKRYKYSEISELTFSELYNCCLELEQSKRRKDLNYGLQIMDMVIKPNDKLSLADDYFKSHNKEPRTVVAKVINEKMVFYKMIPELLPKDQEFKIESYITIPPAEKERRQKCRRLSEERANTTQNPYFKRIERLQPILIYTSELSYYEDPNKLSRIYESLNRFLRERPLLTLENEQLASQWRYVYSCALLTHLSKIPNYSGKAYRGISYDPKLHEGQVVTFKQFLSTSVNRRTAISFAAKNTNPTKFMFELDIQQGYPIEEFSQYDKEKEVLLQPFAEFEVVKVKTITEEVQDLVKKKSNTYTFQIFVLSQILTSKKLPEIRANFVVWVDQNPQEGFNIFNQIKTPTQTTILVQLLSTAELAEWLQKYKNLFTDPTATLIFITNMSRKEGNAWNDIAGIEGLREIRKYSQDTPVFFYIGDVGKANKKMIENKVDTRDVLVGSSPKQVYNYIHMLIDLKP